MDFTFLEHRMSVLVLKGKVLTEKELHALVGEARMWAHITGHLMRPIGTEFRAIHAPMTLFPSLVPASVLTEAGSLQTAFNTLMHKVAHDHEFMENSLKHVVKVDSFVRMLWDIYMQVRLEGNPQPIGLHLSRNDYMIDTRDAVCNGRKWPSSDQLKQTEFNTIAVGCCGLSEKCYQVHRYIMKHAGLPYESDCMDENKPRRVFAQAVLEAWKLYNVERSVILFIVMDEETNIFDQKMMEQAVFDQNPDVVVQFVTLQYVHDFSTLDADKRLFLDGKEVAVIYYRAGYSPKCYPTQKEVEARLRMERSLAIKCPSIHYQLAGCKKVQQELAAPGALERFVDDRQLRERIQKTFAQQFPLDKGGLGDKAFVMAMENPDKFVLKPQREGGGNNKYGDEIRDILSSIEDSAERSSYVLMERLFPWRQHNYLVRASRNVEYTEVVNELGVYGAYIGSPTDEILNKCAGVLLRTKLSDVNEGGLMIGSCVIDSPYVVKDM